jgi:flagella basal body P-ring formation protein FlgA
MMQASNSLLTLVLFYFTARSLARVYSRDSARAGHRFLTPFLFNQGGFTEPFPALLGLPRPPRNTFRPRLGEGSIRSLLALLSFLAALGPTPTQASVAGEGATITLKERAIVRSATVFLGDVAEICSPEAGQTERLARLPVASSPYLGVVLNLGRDVVRRQLDEAFGSSGWKLSGALAVQVRQQGRPVEKSEIVPLLKAHVVDVTSWKDPEIEIRSIGNLGEVELPPGDVALSIPRESSLSGSRSSLIPVEITLEGRHYRTVWISIDLRIRASVLQAARKIPYGKTITPEDVRQAVLEIPDARVACLRALEDAVGLVARRTFTPGDPLTRESLTNPLLIRSGETVRLRLERNGIHIAATVRAEQNGKLGQVIRIRNLDFSRPLKARVVGRGEVKIE